jgi:cell division septal protein FtsQ
MASSRRTHIKSRLNRIKPKKSIFTMLWFWLVILAMIVISTGAYFFYFYSGFQVKSIYITGNYKIKTEDLKNIISNYANTGLINWGPIKINSRSIFLIDKNKMNRDLLNQFPAISEITINKKYPETLNIKVTERKPLGVFCPSESNNGCFSIDQGGVIFDSSIVPTEDTTIVRQNIGANQIWAGEKVLDQKIINAIYLIQEKMKNDYKITLKEAVIKSTSRMDVYTSGNWKVYFDLSGDVTIAAQLEKLGLLLGGQIPPENMINLRYIDLRPNGRAIVCDNNICGQ